MASSERMKKYSSNAKKALKKINTLEYYLKMDKEKLAVKKATRKASDNVVAKSKLIVDVAQEKHHTALQDLAELQKVVTGPVYEWVFNRGYSRAGDSYE